MYLDNHLLVVNKPPGVLVQMDKEGNPSIEEAARNYLKDKFQKPGNVFATASHRLDRPVGGLVVIARTSKALARMNQMFQTREIRKVYLALVEGQPKAFEHLRHWIKKNEGLNKVWTYTYERGDAKQADLAYWDLEGIENQHLLMVRLFTGRHHQIRAQLSLAGFPILGDSKYGVRKQSAEDICLYSYALEFQHPVSKENLQLVAPFPERGNWNHFRVPARENVQRAFKQELEEGKTKSAPKAG